MSWCANLNDGEVEYLVIEFFSLNILRTIIVRLVLKIDFTKCKVIKFAIKVIVELVKL